MIGRRLADVSLLAFVLTLAVARGAALGQADPELARRSTRELIEVVVRQPAGGEWSKDILGCASDEASKQRRAAARELLRRRTKAVAEIEAGLADLKATSEQSSITDNSDWLLCAYAAIRGPSAFTAVFDFSGVPGLTRPLVRNALSLSLGITSFVPSTLGTTSGNNIRCRAVEPRDALDDLILGWMRGDESQVKPLLGARARAALGRMLESSSWTELRGRWRPSEWKSGAVGYRLGIPGRWSEPIETLDEERHESRTPDSRFMIQTEFVNGKGRSCGGMQVAFVERAASPDDRLTAGLLKAYDVDNEDLDELLRLISQCASAGLRQP